MSRQRFFHLSIVLGAIGILALSSPSPASVLPAKLKELRERADFFELRFDWDKACEIYEAILKFERNLPEVRQRYQHCLRRFWQSSRHRDPSFRKEVLSLEYGQAMRLYGIIQRTLLSDSLEKKKVTAARLFRKGLEELHWALTDLAFCQAHMPAVKVDDIQSFKEFLARTWNGLPIDSAREAQRQVREVALAAHTLLGLNATTVIMEFACGACHSLDEYTVYLTPSQLRELCNSLKGETVGVGLMLAQQDNRVVIADIMARSPAAEVIPPLLAGDVVVSIDKKAAGQIPVEVAQEMLEGPAGTFVDLTVDSLTMGNRQIRLRRRAIPSVSYQPGSIGYLKISAFQESTLQELDLALLTLSKCDMKALILDLRGNGGGVFEAAIDTARRFLPSGTIASLQSLDARHNAVYQSRNPDALTLPLVVLVDGDTASAAEVLAGALKENKRARLVGQATYGKGCTQSILKLPNGPGGVPTGGLRVTVARFYSPTGLPYSGRGILPHILVDRFVITDSVTDDDPQLVEARLEAQRLLEMGNR